MIDHFANGLILSDCKCQRMGLLVKTDIGLSQLQQDFFTCHLTSTEDYSIEEAEDGFKMVKVQRKGNSKAVPAKITDHDYISSDPSMIDEKSYFLKKNRFLCSSNKCLVICGKCPAIRHCTHTFMCSLRLSA